MTSLGAVNKEGAGTDLGGEASELTQSNVKLGSGLGGGLLCLPEKPVGALIVHCPLRSLVAVSRLCF